MEEVAEMRKPVTVGGGEEELESSVSVNRDRSAYVTTELPT